MRWINRQLRSALLLLGFGFALGSTACEQNSPVSTIDKVVEDSALAADVLSASGDSVFVGPVEYAARDDSVDVEVAPEPPAIRPVIVSPRQQITTQKPAPPAPRPTLADVSVPIAAVEQSRAEARPEPRVEARAPKLPVEARTGIISSGAPLALVTNDAVCNDRAKPGNTFHARVVDEVRGTNGAEIPAGAQATAEITSAIKWGAGLSVRVKSVRVNGKSYPVSSRVAYVLPENEGDGTCIPDRTRIEVRTTEALRVAADSGN